MDRQCSKCGIVKAIGEFNKHAKGRGGYAAQCRDCARLVQAQWRRENPEKQAEARRRWSENNPEKKAEYMRAWRERNPEAAEKNREATKEFFKRAAKETRAMATNQGKRWSEDEDAILMNTDKPLLEISKQLGRTYGTCVTRRNALRERRDRLQIISEVQNRLNAAH